MKYSGAILSTAATTPGRFVGSMMENFDYGPNDNTVDVVSDANRGWANANNNGLDTANGDAANVDGTAPYSAAANLTYTAPGYQNVAAFGTRDSAARARRRYAGRA